MGVFSLFFLLVIFSLVGTVIFRVAPVYVDDWSLNRVIKGALEDLAGKEASPYKVKSTLSRHFITNRVEAVSIKDVKIEIVDEQVVIDASYEKRVPLLFNIDAVVVFADKRYPVER